MNNTLIICLHNAILVIVMLVLSGCSDENGPIGTGGKPLDPIGGKPIEGVAQKGPYVKGTIVTISPFTSAVGIPPSPIVTEIIDDFGYFTFTLPKVKSYTVSVDGIFYNEFEDARSKQGILLKALIFEYPERNRRISVNVLTHLIYNRVVYLINSGQTPHGAIHQSQNEFLAILQDDLSVISNNYQNFETLSLYNIDGTDELSNALLLYVTQLIYGFKEPVGLAKLLYLISTDFADDGTLHPSMIASLKDVVQHINTEIVRNNLVNYSRILGNEMSVPDIEKIIDTDGDGATNNLDTDDDGDGLADDLDPTPLLFEILTEDGQTVDVKTGIDTVIELNFNNPEDGLFYIKHSEPLKGTLSYTEETKKLVYRTRQDSYIGEDTFEYEVISFPNSYRSKPASVIINVVP